MKIGGRFRKVSIYALLLGVFSGAILLTSAPAQAVTGVNQEMNFQGRLYNAQGATVPDGYYNVEFKIYQDGDGQTVGNTTGTPAGTLKWTESHINANSQGVEVKNGFMSVQLGSVTPFGSSIDWNQDTLWLSMNIAGTNATCTPFASCSPDGEMVPMKRLSSSPYAINSGLLGGLASSQFVQIAQGVQTDVSTNSSSIFINKTGSGGDFLTLQASGSDVFRVRSDGVVVFGGNTDHALAVAAANSGEAGHSLSISASAGGTGATALDGGDLVFQAGGGGGTNGNGGDIIINAGAKNGTGSSGSIFIGNSSASTIQIGTSNLASGTQTIAIGQNTAGGTTNTIIGASGTAGNGTTTIQANSTITIATGGVTRGTFDTTNTLYLGNGVTAAAPNSFTISGTGSTTAATAGGALAIQGGSATVGNTNGGNLILSGGTASGTGASGLVVITTPTFSTTTNDPNCLPSGVLATSSCTVAVESVNNSAAILVGFSTNGQVASLPDPTIDTPGRILYITAANGSSDFTLSVNGGGTGNDVAMRQNTSATMIWNGTAWTAAGASSSTTLQSAYDNTLQSAGGAELVVSKTGNTNGLTIRDSSVSPVDGTLLSIQTSSAAALFSVNSNVKEYSTNGGAEAIGSSGDNSFPSNSWSSLGGASVSRYTTAGTFIATGKASAATTTTAAPGDGIRNTLASALTPNTHYNVSFTARLLSGTFTDMSIYYSVDGAATSVPCTTGRAVTTSVWTKINCTFNAPATGITSNNAILITQASGVARTFYIDNLSVTIAADYNYATDGSVSDAANFTTNWTAASGSSVARTTSVGNDASDSAKVDTTGVNQGVRNKLAINPLPNTLYRVTVYAASSSMSGFNTFTVQYSRDGGTSFTGCADYNTQNISLSLTDFTKVTCYVTTDSSPATSPYVYFTQTDSTSRTFYVDTFAMTLSTNTTPNVQIGGGIHGGPATLLTLDRAASAPIAGNNDALLGSMYYDTTLGKLQCYEADGWGACGSSPDSVVTISPEYNNAVLHGTGIGTMVSDICSDTLNINDGSSSQPTICGTNETFNFYKWTSPQASPQTYSIYVTYQLPSNFKSFASGKTSIMGRTDSSSASVAYQVYRSDSSSGMTPCGSAVAVSSGVVATWQTGTASGTADPSTCGFAPGNSIVFKINATASQNASAYVGNLNFTFNNQ